MKKILILIAAVLFLSGCEATYTINLDQEFINEEIKIMESNTNFDGDIDIYLDEAVDSLTDTASDTSSYLVEKIFDNNQSGIFMKNEFDPIGSYNLYSPFLYSCFSNHSVTRGTDYVELNSGSVFLCFDDYPELEVLNIEIKTKYEVLSHNAKTVDEDTYKWQLTNKDNDKIEIKISDDLANPNWFDFINSNISLQILFLIVAIGTIPSIIIYIGYKRYQKMNEV